MTQKQISKDNRIYWNDKIEKKFDEKKQSIESMFINEIDEKTEKQYPKFLKILGIEKNLKNLVQAQKLYNDFILSRDKKRNQLWQEVSNAYETIQKKFERREQTRKWNRSCPHLECSDIDGSCNVDETIQKRLKENCHQEVEKAFYASPKAKDLQNIEQWREQAKDVLHSDMIGSEVLKTLQNICKQSNIAISIPTEKTLKITQGGE